MKSIDIKDFVIIGEVVKTHGTQGELRIETNQKLKQKEWVMIEFNQKPVPFFMEQCKQLVPGEYLVKFRDYTSVEVVNSFIGKNVLIYATKVVKSKKQIDESIIGYKLFDLENQNEIGIIEELVEMPSQLLFKTTNNFKEILIPAVPDFVKEIDHETETMYLLLPDGLI
jgi:16S rRNA processing protein RimM